MASGLASIALMPKLRSTRPFVHEHEEKQMHAVPACLCIADQTPATVMTPLQETLLSCKTTTEKGLAELHVAAWQLLHPRPVPPHHALNNEIINNSQLLLHIIV